MVFFAGCQRVHGMRSELLLRHTGVELLRFVQFRALLFRGFDDLYEDLPGGAV